MSAALSTAVVGALNTAAEEALSTAEGVHRTVAEAVHTTTAVAVDHKGVVGVSVDILAGSAVGVVDCRVVPRFSLDPVRVGSVLEADSGVLVVGGLKEQVGARSDSHTGLAEVVEARIRSSTVVVVEACHILRAALVAAYRRQLAVLARRALF